MLLTLLLLLHSVYGLVSAESCSVENSSSCASHLCAADRIPVCYDWRCACACRGCDFSLSDCINTTCVATRHTVPAAAEKAMVPSTHGLAPRAVFFDTFALITQPFATTRGACFAPYSRFLFSAPTFIGRIGVRVSSTASSQFTFFINTFPCCSQTFSSTPLISATATIPSTGGTFQYIWSPPWSFTAIPGIVYGIGAVHNTGTVQYGINTVTASAGGITNAVGNGNTGCSLNDGGIASATVMIALDDTATTGNE